MWKRPKRPRFRTCCGEEWVCHWTLLLLSWVVKSCLTLCGPMNCTTPGFPVLHYLLEFAQTRVCWVGDHIWKDKRKRVDLTGKRLVWFCHVVLIRSIWNMGLDEYLTFHLKKTWKRYFPWFAFTLPYLIIVMDKKALLNIRKSTGLE